MKKCKRCGHKHNPIEGIDCKLVNWKNKLTKGLVAIYLLDGRPEYARWERCLDKKEINKLLDKNNRLIINLKPNKNGE